MRIYMMTNTYLPIVGGLEKSVESFSREYRRRGHPTIIVAPQSREAAGPEPDVVRVPALEHFNHTDFAVKLPFPGRLGEALKDFPPDIVHAHHPFLIGDTALRTAYHYAAPLIFTHHTLFEHNTHYVPGDPDFLKRFATDLSTTFANLAERVFVPSESVKKLVLSRGVTSPVDVIPTGVDLELFGDGSRERGRTLMGIPQKAFLAGYSGRLAEEKNLEFLSRSAIRFLAASPDAFFAFIGDGPLRDRLVGAFERAGLAARVVFTGILRGRALADAVAALDVFAFASQSETQGLCLIEAMACGVPVVAIDACAVRDAVRDGRTGRLVAGEDEAALARALDEFRDPETRARYSRESVAAAADYSFEKCADRALAAYERAMREKERHADRRRSEDWQLPGALAEMKANWDLCVGWMHAMQAASKETQRVS